MKQYFFYVGLIFLIGEELLYNTVLVSAIHQHEKQLFWGKKKNPTLQNQELWILKVCLLLVPLILVTQPLLTFYF